MKANFDLFILTVMRKEVEDTDISNIEETFADILKKNNNEIRRLKAKYTLAVSGYDLNKRELFEIEEFREWARKLLSENPECIFFFNPKIIRLLVAACLHAESIQPGVMHINPPLLREFLNSNLTEASQMMHDIGFSEEEFKKFEKNTYSQFGLT
ncbi:hypothetical protein HZB69_03315 [Candidatus Amesbacteria bacterium]|nr:hypothetical protein [Candidatus Amesbacteria bacterium]